MNISQAESSDLQLFANRLRVARKRLGLNQTDFAAVGGVALGSQQRYESGATLPDASYFASLLRNGVDVVHLLSGTHSAGQLDDRSNALLDAFHGLPSHLQEPILAHVIAINQAVASAEAGPRRPPTMHDRSTGFRGEGE